MWKENESAVTRIWAGKNQNGEALFLYWEAVENMINIVRDKLFINRKYLLNLNVFLLYELRALKHQNS
jgi:hypothetical protein